MLQEINVSQFAIIDSLNIEFQSGLNILSGETGSGKSVLLKSLSLLMGEKSSADTIRTGCQSATVEGVFDLKYRPDLKERLRSADIPTDDNQLLVRRIISNEDKSRVYLNGVLSSVSQLREFVAPLIEVTGHTAPLIEMTGQHDNRNLLSKKYHLDLLDQFSQSGELRHSYERQYETYLNLKTEMTDFKNKLVTNLEKLDYLKFQFQEYQNLNLSPDADQNLETEIKRLRSSGRLMDYIDLCQNLVLENDSAITTQIKTLIKKAQDIAPLDEALAQKARGFEQALTILDETVYDLHKYAKKINIDPELLEEKESRLSQVRKLQKKHGQDLFQLQTYFESMGSQISQLENSETYLEQLIKRLVDEELKLKKIGSELHQKRLKFSKSLASKVNEELLDLNMKGVLFDIQVTATSEFTPHGMSDIEFLSQTSAKDPKKPLAKVSSGGELSRILLALKTAVGKTKSLQDLPRTYLFDEVDTGVSGNTAEKVGRKLKEIAQGQQVICVTHLPQVAACGDIHFSISKSTANGHAHMTVNELNKKDRVAEIAKLISGEKITKTSLAHAEQLLKDLR